MPYDNSRGWFRDEADFPGPRTMDAATRWLREVTPAHDRFLLFVDEFDPHEPFDTPEPYASRYDPDWEGPHLIWPPYRVGALRDGVIDEHQARQIRACYGAKLTMIDEWLGRILDELDRQDRWRDTVVILCTDHGHFLSEKDIWGKPGVPVYEPLGHIPLFVAWPCVAAGSRDALTTTVDLHAALLDPFGASSSHRTHGRSLRGLIDGTQRSVRDYALGGIWGREVHLIDSSEARKYTRAPVPGNEPLSMWSNRWSTMPVHGLSGLKLPVPDDRAWLDRMPGSNIPVIRQPFRSGDALPFWAYSQFDGHHCFDLGEDPGEEHDLVGTPAEAQLTEQLRAALVEIEAPDDQFERLALI